MRLIAFLDSGLIGNDWVLSLRAALRQKAIPLLRGLCVSRLGRASIRVRLGGKRSSMRPLWRESAFNVGNGTKGIFGVEA